MSEIKKYKYTVKKFAKMLTVQPDNSVTFQDTVDLSDFVQLDAAMREGPVTFNSLQDLAESFLKDTYALFAGEVQYWNLLVEHGTLLCGNQVHLKQHGTVHVRDILSRRKIFVEFELEPEKVAAWLAATGFPQISRAKEAPNAGPDVVG